VIIIFISYRVPKAVRMMFGKCDAGGGLLLLGDIPYVSGFRILHTGSNSTHTSYVRTTGPKTEVRRPLVADVRQFLTFAQPASVS
jgi:hypothetical protein